MPARPDLPQHIRLNAANGTRFYVGFDEFTANRPVNRFDPHDDPSLAYCGASGSAVAAPAADLLRGVIDQPLSLWCFPFDVAEPQRSVEVVMAHLEPAAKAGAE